MVTSNVVSKNLNTIEDLTKDNLINVNPESEGYKIEYDEKLNGSKLSEGYFF